MLKDPTLLPEELKGWLVRWLEASSLQLPRSMITGIDALCPIGGVLHYPASSAFLASNYPNWLVCDGAAVSRTNYLLLFKAYGTMHGAGDGSTTFNVPDYRDRVPWGLHPSVGAVDTIGEAGGSTAISSSNLPAHTHTGPSHTHTTPAHTHTLPAGNFVADNSTQVPAAGAGGPAVPTGLHVATASGGSGNSGAGGTGATGSTGSGSAFRPPFIVAPFICRAS